MADCARCSVAETMTRRTYIYRKSVIEIEVDFAGDVAYEIWVEADLKKAIVERSDPRIIIYQGKKYLWMETVFSRQHSKDGDCYAVGKDKVFNLLDGFPPVVKLEDVQMIKYSDYLQDKI
jgi:hypothetical protein